MPPPRKLDLIDDDLLAWLEDELHERGFAGYVDLTAALNDRLAARGEEIRVGKSAVHAFGAEHKELLKLQDEASQWAKSWMNDAGLEEEAKRHEVLFQMITTLAFKIMKSQLSKDADEIDPKELHFLGRMLKDVMNSSGIRERLSSDERKRVREETKSEAADVAAQRASEMGMSAETVETIKASILGIKRDD